MLTIVLDMDDVICNLFDEWIYRYNEDYNDNKTRADFPEWDMHHVVKCGTKIYDYLMCTEIYELAEPNKLAQDITKKWIDEGHNVIVATRIHEPCAAMVKVEWMQEHFPHLVNSMHIVTGNTKHYIKGDVMIDDALHNFEGFNGHKFIFDQPWNQKCNDGNGYIRVKNWDELDVAIYGLAFLKENKLLEQPTTTVSE